MGNVLIPKKSTVAAKVPTTSDLALGEIAINYADQKIYGRDPSSGTVKELGGAAGSLSIDTTAADLFSASSGTLTADDPGADRLFFWDDSAGRATHLEVGTGLAITGTTLNNTGGLSGTGSVDNAVLRADGTGGSTLQNSGLIVEDTVSALSITGVASTDLITATGHNFTANQGVRFPSLTGGSGLNTATVYFVRDISGNNFKVSTSSGGAAVNFTTDITAGSIVAIQANVTLSQNTTETNSALVLSPKGTGALIAQKPDGTAVGGTARGAGAVDFQRTRGDAGRVASGSNSVICGGTENTASGASSAIVGGYFNSASNDFSFVGNGFSNVANGLNSVVCGGGLSNISRGNTASAQSAGILCGLTGLADRYAMQAHSAGFFNDNGDAQRARFVLRCFTTTNAAVEMALDGGTTYLTIPSKKVIFMNIKVVGTKTDGSAVATYERQYAVKNVAATSSEVYAPVTIGTDNAAGTSLEVATVDAGDYVRIRPTGITSEVWRWVASVDAVEVRYAT